MFLFSSCGKSKGGKPDPWLRARVCGACYKSEFLEDSTVEFIKATENLNRYTLACIDHIVANDGVFREPHFAPPHTMSLVEADQFAVR